MSRDPVDVAFGCVMVAAAFAIIVLSVAVAALVWYMVSRGAP